MPSGCNSSYGSPWSAWQPRVGRLQLGLVREGINLGPTREKLGRNEGVWIFRDYPFLQQSTLILRDEEVWRVDHTPRIGFEIGDFGVGKANLPTVAAFVKQRLAHAPLLIDGANAFDLSRIEILGNSGTLEVF